MIARGTWQQEQLRRMLTAQGAPSAEYELRGKARTYSLRYQASMRSLLARMRQAGYTVTRTPGINGGEWSARYHATI